MSKRRTGVSKNNFLPPTIYLAMKNTSIFIFGITLTLFSILLFLSIITHQPLDPSINFLSDNVLNNLVGSFGATFSDLALQFIGVSIILPILNIFVWGIRLLLMQKINLFFYKLSLVPISTITFAAGLSVIEQPDNWKLLSGLGGFAGSIVFDQFIHFLNSAKDSLIRNISAAGFLVFGLATFLWTWSVSKNVYSYFIKKIYSLLKVIISSFMLLIKIFTSFFGNSGYKESHKKEESLDLLSETNQNELNIEEYPKHTGSKGIEKSIKEKERQGSFLSTLRKGYKVPPLEILSNPRKRISNRFNNSSLEKNARILENVLKDFGINGVISQVKPGPIVTLYELDPAPGTKTSRVVSLSDDIARSMSAHSVRIAVVPGSKVIGIELPNERSEVVYLKEILSSSEWINANGNLNLALGKNISGVSILSDLSKMPHLLIAGTTGSGKSVAINTMIISLLYKHSPNEVRMLMIDPKMLELSVYDDIPHLLSPVITEANKAVIALKWVVKEMENRYKLMSSLSVRNIVGFNERIEDSIKTGKTLKHTYQTGFDQDTGAEVYQEENIKKEKLPFIVVIIDEMADLMLVSGKEVEAAVQRLAQMARAAGIHVIMATQRPSVDVITGTIKANFPTRISFQVTSKVDSRTILGEQGAEQLLGQGDMLHMAAGGKITRIHGPFVSIEEVEKIVSHLKKQGKPEYLETITDENASDISNIPGFSNFSDTSHNDVDELFDQAVDLVARERKASTSFIQRYFRIGYNRAASIIDEMEAQGMVTKANHVGKREILLPESAQKN